MFAELSERATWMLEDARSPISEPGLGAPRHEKLISVVYKLPVFSILL